MFDTGITILVLILGSALLLVACVIGRGDLVSSSSQPIVVGGHLLERALDMGDIEWRFDTQGEPQLYWKDAKRPIVEQLAEE